MVQSPTLSTTGVDDEEETADCADGRRREGPHQGGYFLEFLPFWKSREVFFCLPHNFHLCFRDNDPS